ncbi:hypothetical protein B0A49_08357, partial [Cryomyces minteri]
MPFEPEKGPLTSNVWHDADFRQGLNPIVNSLAECPIRRLRRDEVEAKSRRQPKALGRVDVNAEGQNTLE